VTEALPWWKRTTVYQIYPRSFADSNGDGIGDIPGIIDRLDYLQWLGVETLWISPFYRSPQLDFGYDISGHFEIAPEYGSLEDVRRLIREVHERKMKIVLDMVLNHTSAEHPWFLDSKSSRTSAHRDYYLWRDGRKPGGRAPPNNWRSMLGGSGWHYDANTGQWYWATFLPFQPDLNWRNPAVKASLLDVVRHWLGEGADGLRLDLFNALYKDQAFTNNPFSMRPVPSESNPDGFFQRALHTQNHPDTLAFAQELRSVVDEFHSPPRFLVGEVFGKTELLRRYCGKGGEGLNLVFLFKSLTTHFSARGFRELIAEMEAAFPEPLMPTYVFSNHDRPRALLRLGGDAKKARLLAAFQLTVRGVPFIYYGDELGLPHPPSVPLGDALDPIAARYRHVPGFIVPFLRRHGILLNRDEARSPMPWSGAEHGGFSAPASTASWLPLHPHAKTVNVAAQKDDCNSVLATYRRLLWLRRQSPALSSGTLRILDTPREARHVLAFQREGGGELARVFLNFSSREQPLASWLPADPRTREAVCLHSSLGDTEPALRSGRALRPWEAIILLSRPQ